MRSGSASPRASTNPESGPLLFRISIAGTVAGTACDRWDNETQPAQEPARAWPVMLAYAARCRPRPSLRAARPRVQGSPRTRSRAGQVAWCAAGTEPGPRCPLLPGRGVSAHPCPPSLPGAEASWEGDICPPTRGLHGQDLPPPAQPITPSGGAPCRRTRLLSPVMPASPGHLRTWPISGGAPLALPLPAVAGKCPKPEVWGAGERSGGGTV